MVPRLDMSSNFDRFFGIATTTPPFPFQREFAMRKSIPEIVRVPTGLGKTAMAVVGWLWRRFGADEETRAAMPRRLVYCLPMRVLVEQTRQGAQEMIERLVDARLLSHDIPVHVLMGGEEEDDWDIHPERAAILVGTQDMLLSRALNRGYAASRSRWPIQFGLLHTDSLWVFDEIQLMGSGLATTTQLEAFRRLLPSGMSKQAGSGQECRSVWMSATMQKEWLETVDFKRYLAGTHGLVFDFEAELQSEGLNKAARQKLERRWRAKKSLRKSEATMTDVAGIAEEIRKTHLDSCGKANKGARTIVVVNTVHRACDLFEALNDATTISQKRARKSRKGGDEKIAAAENGGASPAVILLHSRFRQADRKRRIDEALASPPRGGTIVVSTQVIEAGVDVSATTLFTELAPWASLVQRFGRCNRTGDDEGAGVVWIDLPGGKKEEEAAAPYELRDLEGSREQLQGLRDVGLSSLPEVQLQFEHVHVIRRRDLVDLFDTTPDLAGNDTDIDRFVREVENTDVRVFWRSWGGPSGDEPPQDGLPASGQEELCSAPIGQFKDFAKDPSRKGKVWRWNFLDDKWEKCDPAAIVPGHVFLVHCAAGGYTERRGWNPESRSVVAPVLAAESRRSEDANDADRYSRIGVWQTVATHAEQVCAELGLVAQELNLDTTVSAALEHAARWHDRGKAHPVFQAALPDSPPQPGPAWAKGKGKWKRYSRRHFRHELASALSVLDPRNTLVPEDIRNLVAYLVAAHHGKVRLSIRSLPGETHPERGRRFARGVWDGDELPETPLHGAIAPAATLSLEPMELGLCEEPPFVGLPSWAERMLGLRDTLGPFQLAFLEGVLRAADIRASRDAEKRGAVARS